MQLVLNSQLKYIFLFTIDSRFFSTAAITSDGLGGLFGRVTQTFTSEGPEHKNQAYGFLLFCQLIIGSVPRRS